jgi:hypothetical protein
VKTEMAPFAAELAAPFSTASAHAAMLESAARVGLLASGDLARSLDGLLGSSGQPFEAGALGRSPLAFALLEFALSEDHEELAQTLDGGP